VILAKNVFSYKSVMMMVFVIVIMNGCPVIVNC
jgi:hypothetical protein